MELLLELMPPCLLYYFTGLYCPGCGGTRAFMALIQGQILKSIYYHPLVVYTVACLLWFFLKKIVQAISRDKLNIPMPEAKLLIGIAAGLVIVNWLLRNILHLGLGIAIH